MLLLRLSDRAGSEDPADVVAFAVQHVTDEHVAPVFVGLDYAYVSTHSSYQVLLLQALRSAQRRDARLVRYGMGADVLAHLAEEVSAL